jgi:Ca-activated chloride channel family protein
VNFAQPQFLWLLLVVLPLLGAFFFWSWRVKQNLIAQFVPTRLLSTLTVGVSPSRQKLRLTMLMVAVAAIFLALAGPQFGFTWEEASQRGLDIVVVLDTSRSMLAKDVVPNRIEKAKLAVYDLMRQAKDDRLGLVPFAGNAFLQCPLTLDDQAFRQGLDAIKVGIIPEGGTAISQAIRTAESAFEKNNNSHKAIVLFTDGEDHDSDAETLGAAKEAAEAGINIFTIGVGTPAGELLQVTDDKGNTSFIKDDDGNVVKSHLNETLLGQIASATGGFYLPLVGADPMSVLYKRGLEPLPKSESTSKLTRVYHERYHWPLAFAVICLVCEFLLPDRARARRSENSLAANPSLPAVVTLLCFLLLPLRAAASDAFDKYKSGDYQAAFDEYTRLAAKKTNDYRLQYDAGTAAYRAKQLDAAEKDLNAALASPGIIPDVNAQERAHYNLGNTHFHQGEPATDPKQKQQRWEQAVSDYSQALQLNTNDLDAKNNLAFVRRKLEELKQQQQQQQQNNQDNKDQDQKDQKQQQQNKDQQKQDQKNQDQKNQQQQAQQDQQKNGDKGQQQQPQDQKSDQQKQQEEAQQKQQQQDQQKQQQQAQQNEQTNSNQVSAAGDDQRDKSDDQNQQVASAGVAQMTPQEAKQMLDAQKDDEQTLIFSPENKPAHTIDGKIKDW